MLLAYVGIFLAKLYNMFTVATWYDKKLTWILFIGSVIAWGIALLIRLHEYDTYIYGTLHDLMSYMLAFQTLFLVAELIMHWYHTAVEPVKAHDAMKAHGMNIKIK